MDPVQQRHAERIRDQFTRQAAPFAAFAIHSQAESLVWLRQELRLDGTGRVLDAGCGPGLLACYLAPHVGAVVGLDATPAMLAQAQAQARAAGQGIANVEWREGVMERLPFPDAAFDAVVTRYTLHHVLDAAAVWDELVRVCRPGGRVVVCDAAPRAACRDAYDAWERIRDPSHTSARTPEELRDAASARMGEVSVRGFRLACDLEQQIASSFPVAGGAERLRTEIAADIGVDALDLAASRVDGRLQVAFPIVLVAGTVPVR